MVKDRVIWFCCFILIGLGFLLGSNTDPFTNTKITDWLTSIGTVGAVIVAMWAVNENHRRDTYILKVTASINEKPRYWTYGRSPNLIVSDTPKVTLRVVNVGKRAITVEKLCTRDSSGFYKYRPLRMKIGDRMTYPTIEPGNFFEVELSKDEFGGTYEAAKSMDYFIVDALEKHNKAKILLNTKEIEIVEMY